MEPTVLIALIAAIPATITAIATAVYSRRQSGKLDKMRAENGSRTAELINEIASLRARLDAAYSDIKELREQLKRLEIQVSQEQREKRDLIAENLSLRRELDRSRASGA